MAYTFELIPGLSKDGQAHTAGSCVQDCPNCPLSSRHPKGENLVGQVSDEVQDALYVSAYKILGSGEAFNRLLLTGRFDQPGLPPLLQSPLYLPVNPHILHLALGDLKMGTPRIDYEGILEEYMRRFPVRYTLPTSSPSSPVLTFRVPLKEDLGYTQESFNEAVRLGRGFINGVLRCTDPLIDKKNIHLNETVNALPRASQGVFNDDNLIEKKLDQVALVLDEILGDDFNLPSTTVLEDPLVYEDALHLEVSSSSPELTVSYKLRVIGHKIDKGEFTPLYRDCDVTLAFTHDNLWVAHNTRHQRDESVRFSYEDYMKIVRESGDTPLKDALYDLVGERRLQARR